MGNEEIVLLTLVLTAGITATVFLVDNGIERSEPVTPPSLVMEVGNQTVQGLEAQYCWTKHNRTACIDKVAPEKFSTRAVLNAQNVGMDARFRFHPRNHTAPDTMTLRVLMNDEGRLVTERRINGSTSLQLRPGLYILVVQSEWEAGNVTHVFQIEVKGEN
ncbi:MAG: hypothetical protein SV186_00230 [Candidatus Nanohaloarchaea archaeon]|nr:hypothetical protein [Candidatus Nanohaloarchaea archaeon]